MKRPVDACPRSSDGQLLFLMEMVSKMKGLVSSPQGSRIASVHNGSSLFTGDAGSGESNIRRFIIENDLLETIIQLPNNLFYNTGITTYIWLLSNHKSKDRKDKVQLIDASLLYRKLDKNLGKKNCEFSHEHIEDIVNTYVSMSAVEQGVDDNGIAAQKFDNSDFGYHKVNVERPDRRKAQFSTECIEPLRFDKALREPMQWIYAEWGDDVYAEDTLREHEKAILKWCEENDLILNTKSRKRLFSLNTWQKHLSLINVANALMSSVGGDEFSDFNLFVSLVNKAMKASPFKVSGGDKNAILNAVSWYDESAEKVVKKKLKLTGDKLDELLQHLDCSKSNLPDFGYYPIGKAGEFVTYEPCTDLRDSESVPLKDDIHRYFLAEVKPHVDEAWVNLDSTKIGYAISFNKYFYRHKPLRNMEAVATDIIKLEQQAEGLIADILGVEVKQVSGVTDE